MSSQSIDDLVDRGLTAVEDDNLEQAQEILDDATKLAGENDVRVLHLTGMIAWAEGRPEHAAGYLMQAADADSNDPRVYLDCAECLLVHDLDLADAEAAARRVLGLPDASSANKDQARLLLSQIRLAEEDAEEALEILDEISDERKQDAVYLSTRGLVLLNANRTDEAIAELERAIAVDAEDADVFHWLAQAYETTGNSAKAREAMLQVFKLDSAEEQDHDHEPLTPEIEEDLRSQYEDMLEDLPPQVLSRMANAAITVQVAPTEAQVRAGADPRCPVAFLGQAETPTTPGKLEQVVIMRDLLLHEIDEDDDIPEVLIMATIDELRRFFKLQSLEMGSGEE